MSHATASSSSTNFQLIINNALNKYKKRTKKDLITHPLAAQLQSCSSPGEISAILQQQIQGLDQSQSIDERCTRWLDPTVNVLSVLSSTLAAGVSLVRQDMDLSEICTLIFIWQVFPPANVIFVGVGVLLSVCILLAKCMWIIVIPTYLRQLKTLGQVKTLSSTFLSASKFFSDVSKSIQNCRRPRRLWI